MTDEQPTPDWLAELRAERGEAALAEAARRGIGEQMLADAMQRIADAELLGLIRDSVHRYEPHELPLCTEVDPDDYRRRDTPPRDDDL